MKRLICALLGLMCASASLSCSADSAEADPLKAALRPEWVRLAADHRKPGDDRLVVLIGENHASTRGQIHLADLLQGLLDSKLIDAILVEGSEGPIDIRDFSAEMSRLLQDKVAGHWRQQLEWGRISGWEYVVLTRPQTPTHGVEDMIAKLRFGITEFSGSDEDVQSRLASWERGAGRLEAAVAALEQAGLAQPKARSALDTYRKRLREYSSAASNYGAGRQPLVAQQIELLEAGREAEQIVKDSGLAALRGKKDEERLFRELLEQLAVEQPALLARLSELVERREVLERELEEKAAELEPLARMLADREDDVEDAYFTLANQLRGVADSQWGRSSSARPPEVEEALRSVESFFRDEVVRQREEDRSRFRQQLAERDRAMAANTESYLRPGPAKRVVLVVGSAHLEGMMAELDSLGVPFVAGRLLADESEPWEERAYAERLQRQEKLLTLKDYLPESRLLDAVWREEQQALAARALGKDQWAAPVPGERSVHQSSLLAGKEVPRGRQVVAYGPAPGRPGEIVELWDRRLGRGLVEELSGDAVEVVYGYHKKDAQGRLQYTLATSQGDRSLEEFQNAPPSRKGKQPSYVLTFYEPDFRLENQVPYSPLWRTLRLGGGKPPGPPGPPGRKPPAPADKDGKDSGNNGRNDKRGNGKDGGDRPGGDGGGGKKPPSWTFFAEGPREPRRPRLVRTFDPERGRHHLDRILEQKPLERREVQFLNGLLGLKDIPFALRDGTNAGTVVLVVDNTPESRAIVSEATEARKFVNRQILLITCGNAFPETAALRERLLSSGALMVWTPDRQITPQAGERLMGQIESTLQKADERGERFRDIDELAERSIRDLLEAEPGDPDLPVLRESGSWVDLKGAEAGEVRRA